MRQSFLFVSHFGKVIAKLRRETSPIHPAMRFVIAEPRRAWRIEMTSPSIIQHAAHTMALPTIPTRTDAAVACACGGTARITSVAPIPERDDQMRHFYHCADCGSDLTFDVMKKNVA